MKKSIIYFLLSSAIAMAIMPGCKRGEDDPFLSLRSRDKRITGDWELTDISGSMSKVTSIINDSTTTTTSKNETTTYNGSMELILTTTTTGSTSVLDRDTSYYTYNMTLDKAGLLEFTKITTTYIMGVIPISSATKTGNGRWYWVNDTKNKGSVTFETNGNSNIEGTFEIRQLRNDEMILTLTISTSTNNENGSITEETTSTFTFTKK